MLCLSSKKSLLSGVSAVVLATTVGVSAVGVSGALAQAVDYTHSTGTKVWADNPSERTAGNNGDLTNARADDNLTLEGGVVGFSDTSDSGRHRIGILRGGTSGAGQFIVRGNNVHIDGTIGEIGKPGDHAVNLLIGSSAPLPSAVRSSLSVTRNAVVNDLEIDVSGFTNDGSQGRATFNGNLTVEGTTQIKAGNSPVSPINAILELKGAQNKFAQDITLNDQAGGNAYLTLSGSGNQTIEATGPNNKIKAASDGEGTVQVLNGRDGLAPNRATFDIQIGHDDATDDANDKRLKQLVVGESSKGGSAIFNKEVHVDAIDVIAGNHRDEKATVEFRSDVSGDTITLKGGFHPTSNTGGSYVSAKATFNASTGDITVGNRIIADGSVAGSSLFSRNYAGTLSVIGGRSGNRQHTVTFSNQIGVGGGGHKLANIVVGDGASAGAAIFKDDVHSLTFDVNGGDAAGEASQVTIEKDLTADVGVELSDNAGSAKLTIGGAGRASTTSDTGQTITGDIAAGGDGEGEIVVDNRGDAGTGRTNNNTVTFTGGVGASGTSVGLLTLRDGQTTFEENVYVHNIKVHASDGTTFNKGVTGALEFKADDAQITFAGTSSQSVTGNITADANNRGLLVVNNTGGSGSNSVVLAGEIGATNRALKQITLTDGVAQFSGNVFAKDIALNSGDGTTFQGDVTGDLTFGGDDIEVTFGGAGNQTFTGDIGGTNDNRGVVIVNNTGTTNNRVTFANAVGNSATQDLKQITLTDGIAQFNNAVFAQKIEVTSSDGAEFKGDVTGAIEFKAENARITLNGTSNQTITGNITADANNRGLLVINNTHATTNRVTFANAVGASGNALKQITVSDGVAEFTDAVFAQKIHVSSTDGAEFKTNVSGALAFTANDAKITLNGTSNQTVTGNITADANNRGLLVINNTHATTNRVILSGTLGTGGTNGKALKRVTVSDGIAQFDNNVFAQGIALHSTDGAEFKGNVTTGAGGIVFAGDNNAKMTLNGTSNQTITGNITADANNRGLLVVHNTHATTNTVTFAGDIGTGGNNGKALQKITLSDGQTTFNGNVFAKDIALNSGDGTTFKGHVTGDLTFGGDDIEVTFEGAGNQTFTGDIGGTNDNRGVVIVNNTGTTNNRVTFANAVGNSATQDLKQITLTDGIAQFNNAVFAQNIHVTSSDGAEFKGDVTGALAFKAENAKITLNGTNNQRVTGNITADADNRGLLVINNTHATNNRVTFANAVGASGNALKQITLDDGQTTFNENVFAQTIAVNSGTTFAKTVTGALTLNATATVQGNVTGTLSFAADAATVTFDGTTNQTVSGNITADANNRGQLVVNKDEATNNQMTFAGTIGAEDAQLSRITLDDGQTTFNENVFAQSIAVNSGDGTTFAKTVTGALTLNANATVQGDVTGTLSFTADAATATFDGTGNQTMTGPITSTGDDRGTLVVDKDETTNNHITFTGDIGTGGENGKALKQITLTDGQATFAGKLFAKIIDVTSADGTAFQGDVSATDRFQFGENSTATFNGPAEQTITGNITSASGGHYGEITIANSAGVVFAGQLGQSTARLNSLTVNEEAKVTFNRPVYLSGDLTLNKNSTITLGTAFGERTGDDASDAFLTVGGNFVLANDVDEANKVTIVFDPSFRKGEQRLINKSLKDDKDAGKIVFKGSYLIAYDTDGTTVEAKGFNSKAEVSQIFKVSEEQATVFVAAAVARDALPDDSPLKKIFDDAESDPAKGQTLAEQLAPQTTAISGATTAVVSTGTQVAGVFTDRLSAQRTGDSFAQSGFATGGHGMNRAFCLKPFGSWGKQSRNKKENIAGTSTTATGLAVGVDAPVGDKGRVGTALAYSTSTIKGKGAGQDKTDVKSWQVSLYGDYSTARYYVEGQLGFGRNAVSTASKVATLTRKAAYDTTSLTASVGGGVPLTLTPTTMLTPTAGLSWTRVGSANYTTKGASALNQKIAVSAIDAVVGTLGAQLQRKITRKSGTLIPTARVGLSYDFAGEQTTASGTFTGGGTPFTVKGAKVKKLSGTAGLGLTYATPRWSIGADYALTTRSTYTGHTARLNAKVKF